MDVILRAMTQDEYAAWYDRAVEDYAAEHVAVGNWAQADALELSRKEFAQLLPEGTTSAGQHLYTVADAADGASLGMVWFAERGGDHEPPHAFIYNLEIWEQHRGKGFAKAAMLALEAEVRAVGLSRIALHVFGGNETAIRLYERIGYRPTNIQMSKEL